MSLTSDLLSLTHEQFSTAYGGPDSLTEFLKMKAFAEAGADNVNVDDAFSGEGYLVGTEAIGTRNLTENIEWRFQDGGLYGNSDGPTETTLSLVAEGVSSTVLDIAGDGSIGIYVEVVAAGAQGINSFASGASAYGVVAGASHATGVALAVLNGAGYSSNINSAATVIRSNTLPDASGEISVSSLNYVNIRDEFMCGNNSSNSIGDWGWYGSNGTVTMRANEERHPGIMRLKATGTTLASLWCGSNAAGGPDSLNELTLEGCFRLVDIDNLGFFFGLGYVNTWESENGGYRGLHYDSALSANWRVLHRSNVAGGTSTYVDTGVAAVLGDWVYVKIVFSLNSTVVTIKTTSSPTGVTATGSASYANTGGSCTIEFLSKSSSGTNAFDVDAVALYGPSTRL